MSTSNITSHITLILNISLLAHLKFYAVIVIVKTMIYGTDSVLTAIKKEVELTISAGNSFCMHVPYD